MTYEQCTAYLRKNSILIDQIKTTKPPIRLLNAQEDQPNKSSQPSGKYDTMEKVTNLFHLVATTEGLTPTYRVFAMKSYRESLSIPDKIWVELYSVFKDKINKI
jgi:hypothetical protein